MVKNIFPLKTVGDYYNSHFINAKIDMEKGEGIELAKKYNVKAFPTYFL
jgi:thioredoxin-related protein